jgi:transcriptional regulator with XRE-family HTH domain
MSTDPHPVDKLVGAKIRSRRLECNMSQDDLGKACGVTFQQIQKYENGKNRVSPSRLTQMGRALKCSPTAFFPNANGRDQEVVMSMAHKETVQLVMAYGKIKNKTTRQAITGLVQILLKEEQSHE